MAGWQPMHVRCVGHRAVRTVAAEHTGLRSIGSAVAPHYLPIVRCRTFRKGGQI